MKKILLVSLLISFSYLGFSQFFVGGQFAYNSTWLMNKQVFDEGPEMDIAASFGNYFGATAGYYFNDKFGLELNANFNKIEQKYTGNFKQLLSNDRAYYNASTVLNTTDIPVLLKLGKASYFEFGGLFSFVNKATYYRNFDGNYLVGIYKNNLSFDLTDIEPMDVKDTFKSFGFGVVMGFGANFNLIEDVLKLNFGMRFNYIISDLEGINGLGSSKENRSYVSNDEAKVFKTNPLYGGIKLGLIYSFE